MSSKTSFARLFKRLLSVLALLPVLNGCAISTPFPDLAGGPPELADKPVVLVLTHITVNTDNRTEFDVQTKMVIKSLSKQPGLLGYSARRELFGNQGWTLSVWENDAMRAQFVGSAIHQQAILKSAPAIVSVGFKRLTLPRSKLPANWNEALALLATPEDLRSYSLQPKQ